MAVDEKMLLIGAILAGEVAVIGILLWVALRPRNQMTLIGRDDRGRITEIIERGAS